MRLTYTFPTLPGTKAAELAGILWAQAQAWGIRPSSVIVLPDAVSPQRPEDAVNGQPREEQSAQI
jgi:hypothetical protein